MRQLLAVSSFLITLLVVPIAALRAVRSGSVGLRAPIDHHHWAYIDPPTASHPAASKPSRLSIYADQQGGAPLWQETQSVTAR